MSQQQQRPILLLTLTLALFTAAVCARPIQLESLSPAKIVALPAPIHVPHLPQFDYPASTQPPSLPLPPATTSVGNALASFSSGKATWYNPALGSCGWTNGDNDVVVAVSHQIYGQGINACKKCVNIVGSNGKTVKATVVDKCMGCTPDHLDVSPATFKAVEPDLGVGVLRGISWTLVDC